MKPKRKALPSFQGVGVVPLMKSEYLKKDIIHQHMVSHYRRLYNAKSDIDTSPPQYFKPMFRPRPRLPLPKPALPIKTALTTADLNRIEELADNRGPWWPERDTDRGPVQTTEEFIESIMMSVEERPGDGRRKKAKVQHCRRYQSLSVSPRSSKQNSMAMSAFSRSASKLSDVGFPASSRLREMSIYHPPRRRNQTKEVKEIQTSHAYCSGCLAKISKSEQRGKAKLTHVEKSRSPSTNVNNIMEMQKEDLKYLQFVQNITQDVLKNDAYSNESLEIIFRKHLLKNKEQLKMSRMQDEIQKLKRQLEIPFEPSYRDFNCSSTENNLVKPSDIKKEMDILTGFKSKSNILCSTEGGTSLDTSRSKLSIPCGVLKVTTTRKVGKINEVNKVPKVTEVNQFREKPEVTKTSEKTKNTAKTNGLSKEEKVEDNKVINFLENMGFNQNMAREICDCMSDKDLMNLKIPFDSDDKDWIEKLEEFEAFNLEALDEDTSDLEDSKDHFETYQPTSTSIGEGDAKLEQLSSDSPDLKTNQKIEEGNERASGDGPHEALTHNANPLQINETGVVVPLSLDKNETKKSNPGTGTPMPGVPSPVGSDYSSMKDHEDDNVDSYESSLAGEEADEGRESASEVEEEEIPEDLSIASSSSGISQLADGLKSITINDIELKSNKPRHERNVPCPRTIKI